MGEIAPDTSLRATTLWAAFDLLDSVDRKRARWVLLVLVFEAFTAAMAVGSALPFFSVLSEPELIETVPALALVYSRLGFASQNDFVIAVGLASCALIVLASSLQLLRFWLVLRFSARFSRRLSERVLRIYLSQDYPFFLDAKYTVLTTHILSESQIVGEVYFRPLFEIVTGVLVITVVAAVLLWVNPLLVLFALGGIAMPYALFSWLNRRVVPRLAGERMMANRGLYSTVHEVFAGIKYLRLSGGEARYLDRFRRSADQLVKAQTLAGLIGQAPQYLLRIVILVGAIIASLMLFQPGADSSDLALAPLIPVAATFAFAAIRLLPEFSRIYQASVSMRSAQPVVRSIHEDIVRPPLIDIETDVAPLRLRKTLAFKGVSYSYPGDRRQNGLDGINFEIQQGEAIGIVGPSGAGKTTLADLILGLLIPDQGWIEVDGIALSNENRRAWQRTLGYVPQDIHLANSSLAENIAYGFQSNELDIDKVKRAATMARLDAFVDSNLPDGYATWVGERGAKLSGGQRQRLGIARALYHDPEVIVFDEATSSLDQSTEDQFLRAVEELARTGTKTCFLISHRIESLRLCDRIIVIEAGRIVNFSSWEKLETNCDVFQKLLKQTQKG